MLIGRTLEHARIEVVEAYEQQELEKHKVAYKRLRENELLRTQQVEMAQKRKTDEVEACGQQLRTYLRIKQNAEKV